MEAIFSGELYSYPNFRKQTEPEEVFLTTFL